MSVLARLVALERELQHDRLVVLATLPNGEQARLTARELLDSGAAFVKVVSGNDLHDLDLVLQSIREYAEREAAKP